MSDSLRRLKSRALRKPRVRAVYAGLHEEFSLLDEILRARAASGLTQAQIAARIGTTQSAVARMESAAARHSPSIATLRKYARAIGCRIEVRFVKEDGTKHYGTAPAPRRAHAADKRPSPPGSRRA